MAKVYFTKEITPEGLRRVYEALGVKLSGKIGVKVSTGEAGAKGYLKADLIGPFVKSLGGTIVECNTAYPGKRNVAEEHLKVAEEHGFTSSAKVDIMDAEGEFKIPFEKGKYLKYDIIGTHFNDYDAFINLAHGKGHAMGGFGANLKNQSIGFASRNGKAYIHSAGKSEDPEVLWASCMSSVSNSLTDLPEKPSLPTALMRGTSVKETLPAVSSLPSCPAFSSSA